MGFLLESWPIKIGPRPTNGSWLKSHCLGNSQCWFMSFVATSTARGNKKTTVWSERVTIPGSGTCTHRHQRRLEPLPFYPSVKSALSRPWMQFFLWWKKCKCLNWRQHSRELSCPNSPELECSILCWKNYPLCVEIHAVMPHIQYSLDYS